MSWRPLLVGQDRVAAEAALGAIAEELLLQPPLEDKSLALGESGIALFHAHASRRFGPVHAERARAAVERAISALSTMARSTGLHSGILGVAWAADEVASLLGDPGLDSSEVESLLLRHLEKPRKSFDLTSGLVGIGAYALDRWPEGHANALLEGILVQLERSAEITGEGARWRTEPNLLMPEMRAEFPEGYYNLGLAHGAPGVIAFLAGCVEVGIARAAPLLRAAVDWVLSVDTGAQEGGRFPYWWVEGATSGPARLGWCYGDSSVALVLLRASEALDDAKLRTLAIELARGSGRRTPENSGAVDAMLCHGHAGIALIFHRLHDETEDAELGEHALEWYRRAILARHSTEGGSGFRAVLGAGWNAKRETRLDLLTGTSGVGLALMAGLGDEPSWDRALLLSRRRR